MMKGLWLATMVALSVVFSAGCVAVKPYQRELLAQPGMSVDATPDVEAEQHMLQSREASTGGYGASGGGCGCN
jgi:hypothetical protein